MDDRNSNDWVPIVAGVVVGGVVLTLLYKMFFSQVGASGEKPKLINQQMGAPYKCTCEKGGIAACQVHKKNRAAMKQQQQQQQQQQQRA